MRGEGTVMCYSSNIHILTEITIKENKNRGNIMIVLLCDRRMKDLESMHNGDFCLDF